MTYQWNAAGLWETVSLPAAVGQYLKIASPLQCQVLLWLATVGHGRADAEACARALGGRVSPAECADAWAFWAQEGILQEVASPAESPTEPPVAAEAVVPAVALPIADKPVAAKPAATREKAVSQAGSDRSFLLLLEETSSRLGKALTPADMEALLNLYSNLHLPAEVIMMAVYQAVSAGKRSVRYIERMAEGWAEDGLTTLAQVNDHLCQLRHQDEAAHRLALLLSVPEFPRLSLAHKKLVAAWFFDWQLSDELIRLAYDRCMERTGKLQIGYMNRMLESWHASGLATPEEVKSDETPSRSLPKNSVSSPQDGGFDLSKYNEMLENHHPAYRRKEP